MGEDMRRDKVASAIVAFTSGAILLIIASAWIAFSCTSDAYGAPTKLHLFALAPTAQDPDSMTFVLAWQASLVDPDQATILTYYTRLIEAQGIDTLTYGSVPGTQLSDTLRIRRPSYGDTLSLYAAVISVDIFNQQAPRWSLSDVQSYMILPRPPSPPGDVTLDTIPPVVVDSGQIIPDEISLNWGFGVEVFEWLAIDQFGDPVACTSGLFQETGDTLAPFSVVGGGLCTRDTTGWPPYFWCSNGALCDESVWHENTTWTLVVTEQGAIRNLWRMRIETYTGFPAVDSPLYQDDAIIYSVSG
jgi:hypothetical protein